MLMLGHPYKKPELAKQLIAETAHKQGIQPEQLTLHADNGTPMTGKPLSQLPEDLGVIRSPRADLTPPMIIPSH